MVILPEDIPTIIPHARCGAPECRGFLAGKPGEDLIGNFVQRMWSSAGPYCPGRPQAGPG